MDTVREQVPVICSPKRDIENEVDALCIGSKALARSRLHLIDLSGCRVLYLGSLGLMGGGTGEDNVAVISESSNSVSESTEKAHESLVMAARDGDIDAVKSLIESGDAASHVQFGGEPLIAAARNNHSDIIEWLVENGASIDLQDNDGWTPLMVAAQNGYHDTVKLLADNGASIDLQHKDGWTPLMVAAQNGHHDTVKLLVDNGASIDLQNKDGWTPLMVAAQNGHHDTVKLLADNGASIDLQNKDGWTPLMVAAKNGHHDTLKLLADSGASIDLQHKDGWTPLTVAAQNGHHDTVKLLADNGASIDLQDNDGRTPLMVAAQNGHHDTVKWLVENGASIDLASKNKKGPLHVAIRNGNVKIVWFLILHGAVGNKVDLGLVSHIYSILNDHLDSFENFASCSIDIFQWQGFESKSLLQTLGLLHTNSPKQFYSTVGVEHYDPSVLLFNLMCVHCKDKWIESLIPERPKMPLSLEGSKIEYETKITQDGLFPTNQDMSRILIIGVPGCGKSAFIQKLSFDWSKGNWGNQFTNIFLLPISILLAEWNLLGVSNVEVSLGVAISNTLDLVGQPSNSENLQTFVEEELVKPSTLVILDGLQDVDQDITGNIDALIQQAMRGKHKLLMLTHPNYVLNNTREFDIVVELSSFFTGPRIASMLVEGGISKKKASECIQREKYTSNFVEELSIAIAKLGVQKSHQGIKLLLMAIDSGEKDLFGMQHLGLRMRLLEQLMSKSGTTAFVDLDKKFPVLNRLTSWLELGMKEARKENEYLDNTLLNAVASILDEVPSIVSYAKLPMLSLVLNEVEERRWNVDPSVIAALAKIIDSSNRHHDYWMECMKKGLQNIDGQTKRAAMQCISLMGQFSKTSIPQLLNILLTTCIRDQLRDCTMIELIRHAPDYIDDHVDDLVNVCKSGDNCVRDTAVRSMLEIVKIDPDFAAKIVPRLLEACLQRLHTVSAGTIDVLGICAEADCSLIDNMVNILLQVRKNMSKEQLNATAKAFARMIDATPGKAFDIIGSLLNNNDKDKDSWPSVACMTKGILEALGELPRHQIDAVVELVLRKHREKDGDLYSLGLMLEVIKYLVKCTMKPVSEFISTVRMACKHNDDNIRSMAFCTTRTIAKHRPEELDDELIQTVIERCKNEATWKIRCCAFEAAAEFTSSEATSTELFSIARKALGDTKDCIRNVAGRIIAEVASENIQEQDSVLGDLLVSYHRATDATKHGIVHCFHLLVQKIPETIPSIQSVFIDAATSSNPSLSYEAISRIPTIVSHEHGTMDRLLSLLSRACVREEQRICFCALDALDFCVRRDDKHRLWLLAGLERLPEPVDNEEWLIFLRSLEILLKDPHEDAKQYMEMLLGDWSDKHPRVIKERKDIVNRMSLIQLMHWFDLTSSDLVVHYISRRLLQYPTVLRRTDSSIKLRVYSKEWTAIYDISNELLRRLEKLIPAEVQLEKKGNLRRLLKFPWKRSATDPAVITSVDDIGDKDRQKGLLVHPRKFAIRMLFPGARSSAKGKLMVNDPINDLGKIAESYLKLDRGGLSGSELEQISRQLDVQNKVVDAGFLVYNRYGEVDFAQSIPRHFTEKFINGRLIGGRERAEAVGSDVDEDTRVVKYAVVMSVIAEEVGRDASEGHNSRIPPFEEGVLQRESCPDREQQCQRPEAADRVPSMILEPSNPNALLAGRYMLQERAIPGKDHIKFAFDQQLEKTVVLKFYKSSETFENARDMYDNLDPKYVCRKLAELKEPGLLPCLVFEKAEHSLEDCLNNKDWADEYKKPCLQQILLCLDHLYRRDIVHCDIKPSNILFFLSTHSWKLADLDNARLASWPAPINYTPAYAAPEVLLAEEEGLTEIVLDSSTDLWSFGIIAYEVLTGKRFYGKNVPVDRVKEHLCDRTRPLPSLEYIEESQIRRLIENLLVLEPGKRWSTNKALENATFRPADDSVQETTNSQQIGVSEVTQAVEAVVAAHVGPLESRIEEMHGEVKQVHEVVSNVQNITLSTLQEIELANLMASVVVEEFRKPDENVAFESREAEEALMIKDDYLEEPLFVLRLNDAYRLRISLQHKNRGQAGPNRIQAVFVVLPNQMQKLKIEPSQTTSDGHEVVALLCPTELDYNSMLHPSKRWGNSEDKYAQLKIVIELGNDDHMTVNAKLEGTVYCKMVKKTDRLLMNKAIKNATELWKKCPQWIRSGARGVVILAKVVIPMIAAAAIGDASGASLAVETIKAVVPKE